MARKTNNSITVFEKQKYRTAFTIVLTGRGWYAASWAQWKSTGDFSCLQTIVERDEDVGIID